MRKYNSVLDQHLRRTSRQAEETRACFCRGPQNGEPLCPCKMRGLTQIDGRYVRVEDFGPVDNSPVFEKWRCKCGADHYAKPNFCSECGAKQ